MRLARLGPLGDEVPVVLSGAAALDARPVTPDLDGRFFAGGGTAELAAALRQDRLPELPDAGALRVGAPVARPSAVACIGMNYAAHAAESGSAPPAQPVVFLKTPNTVVGPDDPVAIPRASSPWGRSW